MVVATRLKNKDAHPGIPDLPSPKQAGQSKVTKRTQQKQHELSVTEVAALETELLTAQERAKANARQPTGPGISKNPHSRTTATVGSQRKPSVNLANSGTGTYNCFTMQVKYTKGKMITTASLRQDVRDGDQTMADATAEQRSLVGGRTGNQTGAAAVTVQSDRRNLLTDGEACTGNQDESNNEMECVVGNSDSKVSAQNSKVCLPKLYLRWT